MKKILLLFIFFLIILFGFFLGEKLFLKEEMPLDYSELKTITGEIVKINKEELTLKISNFQINKKAEEEIVTHEEKFYFSDRIKFLQEQKDFKTEEEYKRESDKYLEWYKKSDSEKNLFDFKFSPTGRVLKEKNWQDFKMGDSIVIAYYVSNDSNFAIKVYKKYVKPEIQDKKSQIVDFSAEVAGIDKDVLLLKSTSDLLDYKKEGEVFNVLVGEDTIIREKKIKSDIIFSEEQAKFIKKRGEMESAGENILTLEAPSHYYKERMSLSDLSKGDIVNVEVVIGQDGVFVAKEISK